MTSPKSGLKPNHLEYFLVTALMASLALAQPLFDLLGRQAEILVAHQFSAGDLLALALILGIIIPATLGLLSVLAIVLGRRAAASVFYLMFGALAALALAPLTAPLALHGLLAVGLVLAASLVLVMVYRRFTPIRLFFKIMSAAVLVFPLSFLFFSRATALLSPTAHAALADIAPASNSPDIVVLVMDEFPLVSLLTRDLEIDRQRFPNFARLADQANWYRNATTSAEITVAAVPSLLTGIDPVPHTDRLPITSNHPRNLFTLLHNHYRLTVSETATQLCLHNRCVVDQPAAPLVTATSSLVSDLGLIYRHIITPAPWSDKLPSVSDSWSGFMLEAPPARDLEDASDGFDRALGLAEKFTNVSWQSRSTDVERFVAAIQANDQPQLYYLHTLLPHAVWRYLPSGQQYVGEERWVAIQPPTGAHPGDIWHEDEFAVHQQWQRHLLQVMYMDSLLGKLLDRLEAESMLDASLVVVTGDHGASFIPGQPRRSINEVTLSDISAVPLFVKFPHQQAGNIIDRPVSLSDVFPTLVEVLDIDLDWPFDGVSLTAQGPPRTMIRTVREVGRGAELGAAMEYPLRRHQAHLRERAVELHRIFGEGREGGLFEFGTYAQLLGQIPDNLALSPTSGGSVRLEAGHLYANVSPGDSFVPRLVRGTLIQSRAQAQKSQAQTQAQTQSLAIAVNGVIRTTTRTLDIPGQEH